MTERGFISKNSNIFYRLELCNKKAQPWADPQLLDQNLTIGGQFFMAKYDFEFKKLMVLEYLNGQGTYDFISEKHGMDNSSQLKNG